MNAIKCPSDHPTSNMKIVLVLACFAALALASPAPDSELLLPPELGPPEIEARSRLGHFLHKAAKVGQVVVNVIKDVAPIITMARDGLVQDLTEEEVQKIVENTIKHIKEGVRSANQI